jgi:hypothetical protein
MRVRAIEKTYYNGQDRMPGDEFEMDDREAVDINILTVLGKIERINDPKAEDHRARAPTTYQTTAAQPEPKPRAKEDETEAGGKEGETQGPERRRYYRRSDMRPEE